MTWNSTAPLGSASVKANRVIIQENTTYIEETLGNQVVGTNPDPQTAKDHFWDISPELDGRHRFMQSPAFVDSLGASTVPNFGDGMAGIHYLKTKTALEAPALQKPEPFHKTWDGSNVQLLQLGFRVMLRFKCDGVSQPQQSDMLYYHNVKPYDADPTLTGIQRTSLGIYVVRFATPLPSVNYICSCTGFDSAGFPLTCAFNTSTTSVRISFRTYLNILTDPREYAMLTIVGG